MQTLKSKLLKPSFFSILICACLGIWSCEKPDYSPSPNPESEISKVAFSSDEVYISENRQEVPVDVLISPEAKKNGTITLQVENNGAVYGKDYRTIPAVTEGKIILPVQSGNEKVSFTLVTINNGELNTARSVIISMAQPANSSLKPEGKTRLSIHLTDDETPAVIGFELENAVIPENDAAGYLVKLPVSPAATSEGYVEIAFHSTDAQYGKDFRMIPAPEGSKVRIPVAANATFTSFRVIPNDDDLHNAIRSIAFTIAGVSPDLRPEGKTRFTLSISGNEVQKPLPVKSIRDDYKGELLYLVLPVTIEGVVTSATDNLGNQMLYVQDETGGIAILFDGPHGAKPGQRVSINLEGGVLEELNQSLTITNIPVTQMQVKGLEIFMIPEMDLRQLYSQPGTLEGQMVTLTGVHFPSANGTATLQGVHTIRGNNREARVLVNNFASFRNKIIPEGVVSVTGILVWNNAGYYTIIPQLAGDIK